MMRDDKLEISKEAMRHTELKLEDMLKNGHAVDQRAMTFGAISLATAGILVSEAIKSGTGQAALIPILLVVLGAGIAMLSAFPKDFHVRGHEFDGWKPHLDINDNLLSVYQSQARDNDQRIADNMKSLKDSSKVFYTGVSLTLIGVFFTTCVLIIDASLKQ